MRKRIIGLCVAAVVMLPAMIGYAVEPIKMTRKSPCNTGSMSADGKMIAIGGSGAVLFDNAGKELKTITDKIWESAFTPDGKLFIGGGSGEETITRIYDVGTWDCKLTIPDTGGVLVVSGDSTRLLTLFQKSFSNDHAVTILEIATGKELAKFPIDEQQTYGQALTADGKKAAVLLPSSKTLKVWDVDGKKELLSVKVDGMWGPIGFSGDGKTIAVTGLKPQAWTIATKKEVTFVGNDAAMEGTISGFVLGDGRTVAHHNVMKNGIDLYDMASGKLLRSLAVKNRFNTTMAGSGDGKTLAILGDGGPDARTGSVELFDVATGKSKGSIVTPKLNQAILFLGPNAKQVAVFGYYNTGGILLYKAPA